MNAMTSLERPEYRIEEAIDYKVYRDMIVELLAQNATTGSNQSDKYVGYTKMNNQRMKRLDKTIELLPESVATMESVSEKQIWLVLTEAWCGDAAQNIPIIQKMASLSDQVDLKFHLRDENLDIMDQFLTNGGRSIPKLIILNSETKDVLGTWGPRPGELQALYNEQKLNPTKSNEEFSADVQRWYNNNHGIAVQNELNDLIRGLVGATRVAS